MKAYMFDVESGIFEGETFEHEDHIKLAEGLTTTAPPTFNKGQLAVFNQDDLKWSIVSISGMKERLTLFTEKEKQHHDHVNLGR